MGRGAVAGGSPLTVQAGLHALSLGGNAVDGAIAASLMACVAEPLLTGLGGAGLAIIRMGERTEVCDMFTNAPGKGAPGVERPDMKTILLDFGPTTQTFHVGPASVAVPGLPAGLRALHARYSTLPLATLAKPAIESARKGYLVPLGFERVGRLLWPIQLESEETARIFGPKGERPWRAGDWFSCPPLADTIERYVSTDEPLFTASSGDGLPLLDTLGGHTGLTEDDLRSYEPRFRPALSASYRDARVHVPGSPSVAGILILRALAHLEAGGPMPAALTGAEILRLSDAMAHIEEQRDHEFYARLFEPEYLDGLLAEIETPRPSAGHTTHISVVDADGNAVGITSSLGETAGLCIPGTGVVLNNFLGEPDVNPETAPRPAGERLFTMCCPTICDRPDALHVMGSGGSSRIRSAVLHGLVYLNDHHMSPADATLSPRAHVEFGHLHVETDGRPAGSIPKIRAESKLPVKLFEGANMFFGGLHIAGRTGGQYQGAGDMRRSGTFGVK